jgi:hypothetical protein
MPSRRDPDTGLALRGTSNSNDRGSAEQRRRRKQWLLETYRADVDLRLMHDPTVATLDLTSGRPVCQLLWVPVQRGEGVPAARCFHCGDLLTFETITTDRIIPGCFGGTYRRNNIRPACAKHNSELGGGLANGKVHKAAKKRAAKKRRVPA